MSAEKVLAQVARLEQLLDKGTPRPWWNSHGEPAAGDKSYWDEWEALDTNPDLDEPEANGRDWALLFHGDVVSEPDTALIVGAINALPALLELKRAAVEWAKDRENGCNLVLEQRLAELALVLLGGIE